MPDFLAQLNKAKLESIDIRELKEFYLAGSSIKATLHLNAIWESPENRKSKTVYLEFINPKNKNILLSETLRIDSVSAGFTLSLPVKLKTGNYQIRAYTNWMRNFSPHHLFTKNICIFSRNYKGEIPNIISNPKVDSIHIYPEGGHLLVDQHSKIFIETIDNYGNPIASPFYLLNSKKDTISSGQTDAQGRASFDLFLMSKEMYYLEAGGKSHELNYLIKNEPKLALGPATLKAETSIFLLNHTDLSNGSYLALFQDGYVRYWKRISSNKKNAIFRIPKFENEGRVDCLLLSRSGKLLSSTSYFNTVKDHQQEKNFEVQFSPPIYTNLDNKPFEFQTEDGLSLSGRVLKRNGKPVKKSVNIGIGISSVDSSYKEQVYALDLEGFFTLNNLDFSGDSWVSFITPFYKIELDTIKTTPFIQAKLLDVNWSLISKPSSKPVIDSLEIEVLEQIRKDNELILLDEVKVKAKRIEVKDPNGIVPSVIVKDRIITPYQNTQTLLTDLRKLYCPGVPLHMVKVLINQLSVPVYNPADDTPYDFANSLSVNNIERIYIMKYGQAQFYNCSCAILISTVQEDGQTKTRPNQSFLVNGYQNK